MIHDKSKHECTMHGLQHWFEAKFEKLGWMAIANEYGYDIKVASYLQSISHLKESIKSKINTVHDLDRKDDLKIMLEHTETLCSAAHKLLDSKLVTSSKDKKNPQPTEEHDATFYGLHKWETAMFEKFGWMVLAKNEGNNLKIKSYMHSIHCLKEMLIKKMGEVNEKDRKDDLKILHDDACILWKAATKLLGKSDCMNNNSGVSSKDMYVHSDEAAPGTVVRMNKEGKKHMSHQSSKSMKKHNKPRHSRKDRYAPKTKTKKSPKSSSSKKSPKTRSKITSKKSSKISKPFKPKKPRKSKSSKSYKNSDFIFGGLI